MALAIGSVIRRHLRPTGGFQVAEPGALPPCGFRPANGEELIGWYINQPPSPCVIFTNVALHVLGDDRVESVSFDDLIDYELPKSKRSANGVVVRTSSARLLVPMTGTHGADGRFPDAWSLVSVLQVLVKSHSRP